MLTRFSLDLEMPGKSKWRALEQVKPAIQAGLVSENIINDRAHAVLELLKKTGKFGDRRADVSETAQDLPEHRNLIRQAGAEGIVLLKNEGILPLKKDQNKKVALLGPLAKYAAAHGGGSASLNCHYKISPFDAFSSRLGADVDVTYSKGKHTLTVNVAVTHVISSVKLMPLQVLTFSESIPTWKQIARTHWALLGLQQSTGRTLNLRASLSIPPTSLVVLSLPSWIPKWKVSKVFDSQQHTHHQNLRVRT